MTKAELVEFIAEKADLTKADAGRALEAMIEGITEGLKKEGKVTFVGFGTFTAKKRAAREGRNPQTGETVKIAARVVPGFKAGSKLKDALNSFESKIKGFVMKSFLYFFIFYKSKTSLSYVPTHSFNFTKYHIFGKDINYNSLILRIHCLKNNSLIALI